MLAATPRPRPRSKSSGRQRGPNRRPLISPPPSPSTRNADPSVAKARGRWSGPRREPIRGLRCAPASQSKFSDDSGPPSSARPTHIQSESRLLWADFSKQRKENKSGTFKRCNATYHRVLPPFTLSLSFLRLQIHRRINLSPSSHLTPRPERRRPRRAAVPAAGHRVLAAGLFS